jgi:hypothetical protein
LHPGIRPNRPEYSLCNPYLFLQQLQNLRAWNASACAKADRRTAEKTRAPEIKSFRFGCGRITFSTKKQRCAVDYPECGDRANRIRRDAFGISEIRSKTPWGRLLQGVILRSATLPGAPDAGANFYGELFAISQDSGNMLKPCETPRALGLILRWREDFFT